MASSTNCDVKRALTEREALKESYNLVIKNVQEAISEFENWIIEHDPNLTEETDNWIILKKFKETFKRFDEDE